MNTSLERELRNAVRDQMNYEDRIVQLQKYINDSKYIVAFTGAGISTESNIPDFRSSSGLYMKDFDGKSPEQILSGRFFREKKNKPMFFKFLKTRMNVLIGREPNRSHKFLADLEKTGKLKAIVTQNIDNLHNLAGNANVLELHGNYSKFRCNSACGFGTEHTCDSFMKQMETKEIPTCECGSVIRPSTVLFDECLPDDVFDKAITECFKADLLIAIGSTLQVQPAAGLLSERNKECKLVIINKDTTPYDSRANLIIRENCGEVFDRIKI